MLALVGMIAACPAAVAQRSMETDTGSMIAVPTRARIPEEGAMSEINRGREVMRQFAQCALSRNQAGAERALAMPIGGAYYQAINKLAVDECLSSGTIKFKAPAMRGALFAELYRRKYRAADPGLVAEPVDFAANAGSDGVVQAALDTFADCVVRRDPADARAIVLRPIASKEQDKAFAAVYPHLGPCLAQGQQITLNKPTLENAFAEVLYREAATPGAAAVEKH